MMQQQMVDKLNSAMNRLQHVRSLIDAEEDFFVEAALRELGEVKAALIESASKVVVLSTTNSIISLLERPSFPIPERPLRPAEIGEQSKGGGI